MATSEATLIEIEERPAEAGEPRKKTGGRRAAGSSRSRGSAQRLGGELRQFIAEHPQGWGHGEWLGLLDRLRAHGHDAEDADGIGQLLERERLTVALERVRGLGPQRLRTLVDRYQTLWNLRHADVEEVAKAGRLGRPLAERVREALNA
jgi:hypothetical protein